MKRISKEKLPFIVVGFAYVITFIFIAIFYLWVKNDNKQIRQVELAAEAFDGEKFVFSNFTVEVGPRGGDSGAWIKDPIYDDSGNELHGQSVGTIYELTLTNTSEATITDWVLELHMPEYLWINNAWCGTMEIHQSTGADILVQELDLREFTDTEITLEHYIDHTGPMIPMNKDDKFVYYPSEADNEMPLDPDLGQEEVNNAALIGFIVYIPDQALDYVTTFDKGTISYHLHRSAWDMPLFLVLVGIDIFWLVLFVALIISQFRIHKLLKQQKHDAMIIEQSINTFINFIEAKDPNTKGHSERVAKISYSLAKVMGYSELECNRIYYIALMHDCGKISIPVTILQKPDKLTAEEYEVIKSHTLYGDKMLRDFTSIEGINLGALYHHERYDGKGYPTGLAGEDIPLIARIICVADSLDAMNSNRCYRPRLTKEVIMEELIKNKGKQFDAVVVDHLIKLIKQNVVVIGEPDT